MTKRQMAEYRKALTALAANLNRGLVHDQRELMRMDLPDVSGGPIASTDEVLDSGTQEIEAGLAVNEQALLTETNAALARLDAGTFGRCEQCGSAIPPERLDAVPYARHCIGCARVTEAAAT